MQPLDSYLETAIRRGHAIKVSPLVIAEWNYNHFTGVTAEHTPATPEWAYGNKRFPVSSVTGSYRPNSGIFFAFTDDSYTSVDTTLGIDGNRYYTVDQDDYEYTYWMSPEESSSAKFGATGITETDNALPEAYGLTRGLITVNYPQPVNVNKLKIAFNLGPMPVNWTIRVHQNGSWTSVTPPTINPITGRCEMWWNGTTWVNTQQLNESVYVSADKIEIDVNTINAPAARLQVIEVALGREMDLTNRMESYNIDSTMDQGDFIHPVGKINSNDGSIIVNNSDEKISGDPDSDFNGLLAGNCQYRIYVKYDLSSFGGSSSLTNRVGTMYGNGWKQINEYEYEVDLFDIIKVLQNTTCPPMLYENISLARIISSILDIIGIDSYELDPSDFDDSSNIKYFWTDGTQTVYEALESLCLSNQASIFVDELGKIQLLIRDQITGDGVTPVWTFRGQQDGLDIPDVIEASKKYALQANEVTIKYHELQATVDRSDITSQQLTSKIWDSTETVVLRASPILRTMTEDGINHAPSLPDNIDVFIKSELAISWPYSGQVNIDGEVIDYKGKGYKYYDHGTNPPTAVEIVIQNDDEKRKWDKYTWDSYTDGVSFQGGIGTNPAYYNGFTGRLFVTKRNADETGMFEHRVGWSVGWAGLRAHQPGQQNPSHPGKLIENGNSSALSWTNVRDNVNKTNWSPEQYRWTMANSILTGDNSGVTDPEHLSFFIKDMEDTEYRSIGTRVRLVSGPGQAGIVFYLSNAVGYDNVNPGLTNPFDATRWYILNICSTNLINSIGRPVNEIHMQVRNGSTITTLPAFMGGVESGGKWNIEMGKWYDVDLVFKDGTGNIDENSVGASIIEVYVDGQLVEVFHSTDNIRPTSLMGLAIAKRSVVEFEYFYGTTTATNARPTYPNDELFHSDTVQLPAGTGVTTSIDYPTTDFWYGEGVIAFTTASTTATISSLKFRGGTGNTLTLKEIGPLTLKPDQRIFIDLNDVIPYNTSCQITYTASNPISVCVEYTRVSNYPYGVSNFITAPSDAFYDYTKGGYLSKKRNDFLYIKPLYANYYESQPVGNTGVLTVFDDFGPVAHEMRTFDVKYDISPAKGPRIFLSNSNAVVVSTNLGAERAIFTLANTSHKNEIINGNEEIDESNSIDHTLMLYGHVLEDRGERTKIVKNEDSIRKYGKINMDIDGTWIFDDDTANDLGNWITDHWGEPMDIMTLSVFSNSFIQIGDIVNILYTRAGIDASWKYVVTATKRSFDDGAFSSILEVRRVA